LRRAEQRRVSNHRKKKSRGITRSRKKNSQVNRSKKRRKRRKRRGMEMGWNSRRKSLSKRKKFKRRSQVACSCRSADATV
jgi:hypothetical protein